jgi:hypothetical protein
MVKVISRSFSQDTRLAMLGTVQFTHEIHRAVEQLQHVLANVVIPQVKPLSPGSVGDFSFGRIAKQTRHGSYALSVYRRTLGCTVFCTAHYLELLVPNSALLKVPSIISNWHAVFL